MREKIGTALLGTGLVWIFLFVVGTFFAACAGLLLAGANETALLTWPATIADMLRGGLTVVVVLPGVGLIGLGLWLRER